MCCAGKRKDHSSGWYLALIISRIWTKYFWSCHGHTLLSFRFTRPSVISASDLSPLSAGSSARVLARHFVTASICFITRCMVRSVVSSLFCNSDSCFVAEIKGAQEFINSVGKCWCKNIENYIHNIVLKWWSKKKMILLKLWVLFDCSEQPIWKKFTSKILTL